jgi:hypothetical protein
MPVEQFGQVYETSTGFGLRWRDETAKRRRRAGFSSRSAARTWFRDIESKRMRGETPDDHTADALRARRELPRAFGCLDLTYAHLVRGSESAAGRFHEQGRRGGRRTCTMRLT